MIDFIKSNWQFILTGLSAISIIFNIILLLKKGVPLTKIMKVIKLLPSILNNVEQVFPFSGTGSDKKELAISLFTELCNSYGVSKYIKYIDIDNLIEEVLTSPTKKQNL